MSGLQSNQKQSFNSLLAVLPREVYTSLLPNLETVSLVFKQVLYEPKETFTHVYFPINSLVSLFTVMADSTPVEVGVVGNQGMVGLPVFLGIDTTSFRAIVQIPGDAMRMKVDVFKEAVNQIGYLSSWLQHYAYTFTIQISQSSACNSHHSVEQRCCRWLLTMHDTAMSDQFTITQEFLAHMVNVRRASVTEVALRLQKAGLICYSRGKMTILDRKGLEAASCECYAVVRSEFERLFG